MVRASWCVLTVGLLLLPVLHGAYSSADDDSFEVSDAVPGDAAAAANAPPPPPGRKKNPKKPKKSAPVKSAGIHVTYKNADGEDKDLDDELRLACNRGDLEEVRKMLDIRKEVCGFNSFPPSLFGKFSVWTQFRGGNCGKWLIRSLKRRARTSTRATSMETRRCTTWRAGDWSRSPRSSSRRVAITSTFRTGWPTGRSI